MLPTFTDQADKLLVQLAYEYVSKKRRVVWSEVARKLRKRRVKKTPKELETRLRTLQRAHGVDLAKFPPCFFGESKPFGRQGCKYSRTVFSGSVTSSSIDLRVGY
eukprot:jgi/Phyca11/104207/e_gw1.9.670.1